MKKDSDQIDLNPVNIVYKTAESFENLKVAF